MDWPQTQDYNRVVIASVSPEAAGQERYSQAMTFSASVAWVGANLAIYIPFLVYQPLTVLKMGVLNGSVVSGNVDVGIHDSGLHRLVSSGSTAQAGTSVIQPFDITDTLLLPGEYFMSLALDNITATVGRYALGLLPGATSGILQQASAFPLPDPAVPVANASTGIPAMMLTTRTLI